jgi:hypothetical protein
VIRWNDLHPGRLIPADGQLLEIERRSGDGWERVSWDDDSQLEVRAIGRAWSRGYGWEARWATSYRGEIYRVRLLPHQGLPAVTVEMR